MTGHRPPSEDSTTDVVRWAAFSCVLVPVVLVWYGTSLAGATGTALGLGAVTAVCRILLRQSERGAARPSAEERAPRHGRRHRTGTGGRRGGRPVRARGRGARRPGRRTAPGGRTPRAHPRPGPPADARGPRPRRLRARPSLCSNFSSPSSPVSSPSPRLARCRCCRSCWAPRSGAQGICALR